MTTSGHGRERRVCASCAFVVGIVAGVGLAMLGGVFGDTRAERSADAVDPSCPSYAQRGAATSLGDARDCVGTIDPETAAIEPGR